MCCGAGLLDPGGAGGEGALALRAGPQRLTGFPPVYSPDIRVLVLGSMPGRISLQAGEYYANPRNLFWLIMHELFGIDPRLPYLKRLEALTRCGVGLWDVLQQCERAGSLDAAIVPASEVPNDFAPLLDECRRLRAFCFNGRKAAQAFRRHVLPSLPAAVRARVELVVLPSTSPANAGQSFAEKLKRWRAVAQLARAP